MEEKTPMRWVVSIDPDAERGGLTEEVQVLLEGEDPSSILTCANPLTLDLSRVLSANIKLDYDGSQVGGENFGARVWLLFLIDEDDGDLLEAHVRFPEMIYGRHVAGYFDHNRRHVYTHTTEVGGIVEISIAKQQPFTLLNEFDTIGIQGGTFIRNLIVQMIANLMRITLAKSSTSGDYDCIVRVGDWEGHGRVPESVMRRVVGT